jgi:hypothetical protein
MDNFRSRRQEKAHISHIGNAVYEMLADVLGYLHIS